MATHLIETLRGVGDIYSGDVLLRAGAAYQLSLWSDNNESRDSHDPHGAVTIDGNVAITGIGEAVVLLGPGGDLTLRLQDGRRLAFSLTSTTGHIVGRGGLQPA